jgi:hypothetical protein
MMDYVKRTETFDGDNMEVVVPPSAHLREWDHRYVFVTHDECCFYSNDATQSIWQEEGESIIKKKGQGGTIMVSEFLCACHGRLRLTAEEAAIANCPTEARVIIKPGKNQDGYWKSEDMVKQLKELAIPIFEALHPGCVGTCGLHGGLTGTHTH